MNIGIQVKYGLEKVWDSNLTNSAKMLYVELFIKSNKNFWEKIQISNEELINKLGITKEQLRKAKKELQELGFIEIVNGKNKNQFTTYKIIEKDNEEQKNNNNTVNNIVDNIVNNGVTDHSDDIVLSSDIKEIEEELQSGDNIVNYGVNHTVENTVKNIVTPEKVSYIKELRTL